jgi:hypothetical protein
MIPLTGCYRQINRTFIKVVSCLTRYYYCKLIPTYTYIPAMLVIGVLIYHANKTGQGIEIYKKTDRPVTVRYVPVGVAGTADIVP